MKTLSTLLGIAVLGACLIFTGAVAMIPDAASIINYTVPYGDAGLAMATLAANQLRDYQLGDTEEYPVIASDIIYQGAAVGENGSGYSRPLVAGDVFQGFAEAQADNSAGAAGAINVNVKTRGRIVLDISGLAITANDRPPVYASDDNTFTLTPASNSLIGYVSRWIETGKGVVEFDAGNVRAALQS